MKGFNKWNQKENKYNHECYSGELAKGWKAALEWIMQDCCPEAWCVHDIEFDIAEELGYAKKYLKDYDIKHGINNDKTTDK